MTATVPAVQLVSRCGMDLAPDAGRWFCAPDGADLLALDGLDEPVLDIGCGPGRIVSHLVGSGVTALGIDVSAEAVDRTRDLGAPVLHRSVFDPLPGTGRWGGAVLLDGNIGIGGDPVRLLDRVRELLRPGGRVVAELAGPDAVTQVVDARISVGDDRTGWFSWAVVGNDRIAEITAEAGLVLLSTRRAGTRHFAMIQRR